MRSTFTGLSIAQSGLFASQRSLDIIGHNISNANTKGYTRQRLDQAAANPMSLPGGKGQMGLGTEMLKISQVRDELLDIQYRAQNTELGFWEERYNSLSRVETVFNEPNDNGIRKVMDKFYTSLHDLSKDPSNPTARAVALQNGVSLAQTFNDMNTQFEKMVMDLDTEVVATVREINTYAEQIAMLNEEIYRVELSGNKANDLRDKRNLLVDDLSKLIDIQVVEVQDENTPYVKMNILVQGTPLVSHKENTFIKLNGGQLHDLTQDGKDAVPPRDNLSTLTVHNLTWDTGAPINQEALRGVLGGQLAQRDNIDGDVKGVPYYVRMINEFASEFAKAFNDVHKSGQGLQGETGLPLFAPNGDPGSTEQINAKNIRINQDLIREPGKLAVGTTSAVDDNKNVLKMIELREQSITLKMEYTAASGKASKEMSIGKPDDVLKSLIGVVGVDAQQAFRVNENQITITESIDTYRMSVSGVHQDEEMANMIKYQHAYNASARMITTVDEMIDVIINRMGRVGL